jgi:ParB family chromosome partitioning protein
MRYGDIDHQYDAALSIKERKIMNAAQPKGLGKGLSALMNDNYTTTVTASAPTTTDASEHSIALLPLSSLRAGTYQPRQHFNAEALNELADSIGKHGIMQPIVVRQVAPNAYEIIAGERRYRAAQMAKLATVPAIVRELSDSQALEMALVENIQRKDLNPLEEAAGYQRLMDEFRYTQEELAKIVGKSRSHVANLLRLLALPEKYRHAIDSGELTMGHARALLSAKDPEALFRRIGEVGMSVRQAEEWLQEESGKAPQKKAARGSGSTRPDAHGKSEDVLQIEHMLAENLGLKVSINTRTAQAGEVVIGYDSLAQLDEILRRLGGSI